MKESYVSACLLLSGLFDAGNGLSCSSSSFRFFPGRRWQLLALVWLCVLGILGVQVPRALAQAVTPPGFALENHSATDGAGTAFNSSVLPLNVSGANTLLLAAWHAEFDGGNPNGWKVEYAGIPGTLLVETNGYEGGSGNRRFRIYSWLNPTPGLRNLIVTNAYNGPNELSVVAILLTNVSQINPLGAIAVNVSTSNRTGESETVNTTDGDLVVHVIANRLVTRGDLGPGETSRSIANDGSHPEDGDASLWVSTKPGAFPTTTVSSTNWASYVLNGVAIVVRGSGPVPSISDIPDQNTTVNTPTATVPFTVADADTPLANLILSADSSNQTLLPNSNVVFGGSDANRTISLIPASGQTGTATVTVTVSDGVFASTDTFVLTVISGVAGTLSFTNTAPVTIPGLGNATPYPSVINVNGLSGTISQMTARLNNWTHTFPGDVDILLVGPAGQRVMLASDAGGAPDVVNVTLTFSDAAAATLSVNGPIVTGTFKPTDFEVGSDSFPVPAPAGPYGTALSVFNGQVANGTWSLYALDDGSGDQGSIGSWTLTITTVGGPVAPTVSDIPSQTTLVDTPTAAIPFTVTDTDTPLGALILTASSSNPTVVPDGNIVFGGSGANRTVTATPAASQTGTTTVTVTVSDGALTASDTFVVTVSANTPPTISNIPDQNTPASTPTPAIPFAVADLHTPAAALTLSGSSSNPTLVPDANVVFGGSGANRTVTLTPVPGQTGTSTITVNVTDGVLSASDTFVLTVSPGVIGTLSFTNAAVVTIPDVGIATPYPSAISVNGLSGTISQLTARFNMSQTYPGDVDVLLVGPGGQAVMLMSDAGSGFDVVNVALTFSDAAPAALPANSQIVNGTFRPTDYEVGADVFPAPAPAGPYGVLLSVFNGQAPNGTWSLYVLDDGAGDQGSLGAGWSLTITTVGTGPAAPTISDIGNQGTLINTTTAAIPFTVGDVDTPVASLVMSGSSSNPTLVPNGNIVFGGTGANRTVTVTPAAGQTGTATITATVSDGALTASDTFLLTVSPGNTPPTISDIADQSINEDTPTPAIPFTVGDGETAAGSLTLSGSSSNAGLVPNANVTFGGSGANRTVTVTPVANQSGSATITVAVSDGTLTTNDTFVVTVTAVNDVPTISNITDQSIEENTPTAAIPFTVGDVETAAGSLTVSGSSSNPTLVPNANVTFGGSGANRTVTVTPANGESGTTTVTVTVSDGDLTASDTFVLSVNQGNTPPTLSGIADQTINEDTPTAAITFTVGDAETAPGSLTVSGSSSNPGLVPNANVSFGGSGANRTVTVTPAANQSGSATIAITVSDGTLTTNDAFVVTVSAVNDGPTITNIPDQSTALNTPTAAIPFTVGDEETAAGSLTLSGVSSNPTLVPNGNIVFGGSGANRTVTITPASGQSGATTITVTLSDGGATTNDTFVLTVDGATSGTRSFTNSAVVTIPSIGIATPYPSVINVSGLGGTISDLTVRFNSFSQTYPGDVDVLLVGPGGQTVIVMSDASGTFDLVNVPLAFSDAAPTALPVNGQIVTGTFKPTNYEAGTDPFPAPAPAGPYGATLSVFNGQSANGTWSLYAVDDGAGDQGSIGGWSLTLTTVGGGPAAPTISDIADQATLVDTPTAAIPITVGDTDTPVASLTLSGTSSNPALLPNGNIVFGGSGVNRTVTLTPAPGQTGTSTITVTVSDGALTATDTFVLSVNLNTPPTISNIPDQSTSLNTATAAILFTVGDSTTPAAALTLSGTSPNPTLVANIAFGGSGANRTVTITPAAGQTGTATITLTVSDGTLTADDTFVLVVNSGVTGTLSFTNNAAVTIPSVGPATPYPSVINVAGLSGAIAQMTVRLHNFSQTYPGDVDVLLVGPGGQSVILVSDAGGTFDLVNVTVAISDAAASAMPVNGQIVAGTYRPTDFEVGADVFSAPAPAGPYGATLSVFNGQGANGAWSLYVVDDGDGDQGALGAGWSLTITTIGAGPAAPTISDIANQSILINTATAAIPFTVGDLDTPVASLVMNGTSSNPTLVPNGNIVFGGTGANRTVTVTPVTGQTGNATITATVSDGALTASDTFVVTVGSSASETLSFTNAANITIPGIGLSTPYPSAITVAGMGGTISLLTVRLNNVSHTYPGDVDILLVSPTGQTVLLMSDCGATFDLVNVSVTFSDAAASGLPASGQIVTGSYRPTNFDTTTDAFSPPAPAGPYGSTLSGLSGQSPNGVWALYGLDDGAGDQGTIVGWSLTITTSITGGGGAGSPVLTGPGTTGFVNLKALGRNASGAFQLQVEAKSATGYVVEVSDDLIHWSEIAPLENIDGNWILTDRSSGNHAQRFYRLVHAP